MKLTWYDRLLALAFNPQYRNEYESLFPKSSPSLETLFSPDGEIENFRKRWGLEFIVNPQAVERGLGIDLQQDMEGGFFSDYKELVKVIPHQEAIFEGDQPLKLFQPQELKEDRYLTVSIDIRGDATKILAAVRDYIKLYRRVIKFSADKRAKSSKTLDHWDIYARRHNQKKSLLQMAKEIAGSKENPAYNSKVNRIHKQVLRAYKKAEAMISQVTPSDAT